MAGTVTTMASEAPLMKDQLGAPAMKKGKAPPFAKKGKKAKGAKKAGKKGKAKGRPVAFGKKKAPPAPASSRIQQAMAPRDSDSDYDC